MKDVYFLFKLLEGIFSLICTCIHIVGFLDDSEPFPHELFFCGTYFAFVLISILGLIGILFGFSMPMILEAMLSGVATFLFISSSIVSMKHAEDDEHLQYLSDVEESEHPFFYRSKYQSIFALVGGCFYMLHLTFSLDSLIITQIIPDEEGSITSGIEARQPIKLWLFYRPVGETCIKSNPSCDRCMDCACVNKV